MQKLVLDVFSQIEQLVPEPCHLVLGYSGGVDSRVLLEIVWQFVCQHPGYTLEAVYVHHGLSEHADDWARHCQQVCQDLGIACSVACVTINRNSTESLENAARQARYDVFRKHMSPGSVLLTAHHLDDQLETVLLALKRGAGPRGLAGMLPKTEFAAGYLVRPLLFLSRQTIQQWATQCHLHWIEDESNLDQRFDRNFLRQNLIPQLKERWPEIATTAARSASLCAEEEQLLAEYIDTDYVALVDERQSLPVTPLLAMSVARRHQLLRYWLRKRTGTVPSLHQLDLIWQEVALAAKDANPCLHWSQGDIRRYQDRLYHVVLPDLSSATSLAEPAVLSYPGQKIMTPAGTLIVESPASHLRTFTLWLPSHAEIVVQYQLPGSVRIHPAGRAYSRELKKIWQEYGIPPWLRTVWPCLCWNNQIVAIPGVLVTQACAQAREKTEAREYVWQPNW